MQIYLVRHAIAEPREAAGILDDAGRRLTPEGAKKMQRHARALAALGLTLDEIWTSPLVRAVQTAEILAAGLGGRIPLKTVQALKPDGDFEAITRKLAEEPALQSVAMVGHEPYLGSFAGYLLGGDDSINIRFKKGGVALVEVNEGSVPLRGELAWLLTPKQMALIG